MFILGLALGACVGVIAFPIVQAWVRIIAAKAGR